MTDINDVIKNDLGAVFFAEGGIGVDSAVYRSADNLTVRSLQGIFDNEYAEAGGEFAPVAGRRPVFLTRERYDPDTFTPVKGASLEIQVNPQTVTTYTIQSVEPDGNGMVLLGLEET